MTHQTPPKRYDDYFDPELSLIRVSFNGPGYHSLVPSGTMVHDIRSSFEYAFELVCRNDSASDARAIAILEKLLPLQDRDSVSQTYGIWSWLYEEPLSAMSPPDWNWADFCGFRIAQILLKAGDRLPDHLRQAAREALFHAAGSIYRRNMGPHYTNISIMGGLVTALAGEILDEPRMLAYGIRRLKQAEDHHRAHGSFNEYNSPTYTFVVLFDCEQALGCLRDSSARNHADYLFHSAWEVLANHFHPATGQWAGPHSRDYAPFLRPEMAESLEARTGARVTAHPSAVRKEFSFAVKPEGPRCPDDLVARFKQLPKPEYEIKECYIRRQTDEASTMGTTWMHEEACLGSVNHEFFWDQRRVVLGYWNGAGGTAVALRLRFMHDGKEFASASVRNAQAGPKVLSAAHLLLGRGDFHPIWGGAENDIFTAEDFRLRYELRGDAVEARELDGGGFLLSSGEWGAVLAPVQGTFDGVPVTWRISRGEGWVALDGVAYEGPAKEFPFRELKPAILAVGLHLRKLNDGGFANEVLSIDHQLNDGFVHYRYAGMEAVVPDHAIALPEGA